MSGIKNTPLASASNGSNPNTNNANGVKKTNAKKKPTTNDKGNGKPNGGSVDASATSPPRAPPPGFTKSAPVPNAWATPLAVVAPPVGFSESHQRLLRHRALFVFRFLVGKAVEVTLVDASRYVGILDCVDPDDFSIVLKNTQRNDGASDNAFDSGSTVIFKRRQLAHIAAEGVVNYNDGAAGLSRGVSGGAPGFQTDTEISNRSHEHLYGRELESATSWLDPQLDTGDLEESNRRKSGWNQFEANEKLFGVVSTYDENLYTTKLDKTKISTEKSREAERLAREIERETTGNFHLQEERGQAVQGEDDLDEEAKYSSVDRKNQTHSSPVARSQNAYVPPALRNASRPTSAGQTTKPHSVSPPHTKVAVSAAAPAAAKPPSAAATTSTLASAKAATTTSTPQPPASVASTSGPTPTPAADPVPQPRKPISFSEAVTGRPAARPSPTLSPAPSTTAPAPKAPAKQERNSSTSPKKQASPKSDKPEKMISPTSVKKEQKPMPQKGEADKKPVEAKASEESNADKKDSSAKTESTSKPTPATTPVEAASATDADSTATTTAPAPSKKTTLNPKAREFKLSASAAAFTPKFAAPPVAAPVTSSPYRQPNAGHYGIHPPPPHPAMAGMSYGAPGPEEWMYDGMMPDESEYAAAAHAYMGYGVPMIPNPAMMQQPMYAPMIPPQQNARMGRAHGGGGGGYGYNQPGMYNPRGYYGQGAVPGAMPYHAAPGAIPGIPQPPLPPTPADGGTPLNTPLSASPGGTGSQRQHHSTKNTDTPSKK